MDVEQFQVGLIESNYSIDHNEVTQSYKVLKSVINFYSRYFYNKIHSGQFDSHKESTEVQIDNSKYNRHMCCLLSQHIVSYNTPTFCNCEKVGQQDSLEKSLEGYQAHYQVLVCSLPFLLVIAKCNIGRDEQSVKCLQNWKDHHNLLQIQ